jgi:nicotinamidase-related amidase
MRTDRLSGLWGAQTPLGLYLQENDITTIFFGGVNADQCVVSTRPSINACRHFTDHVLVVWYYDRCILQGRY